MMHAYLVLLPALMPLLESELGSYETIGLIVSLVFFFYGWGSLPAGFLADRYPKKVLIVTSMAVCGASAIIVGLSESMMPIAGSLVILGMGASLYHPAGYASMSLSSVEMRGRYMGIQGLAGDFGMALSYVTSAFLGFLLGWRNAFLVWGIAGIAVAMLDLLFIVEPNGSRNEPGALRGYREILTKVFSAARLKLLALVFLIVICSGGLWSGVSSFIVAYTRDVKGIGLVLAGGLSTISYTIGGLAQLIGGEVSDRQGRSGIMVLGFGAFAFFLLTLTMAPGSTLLVLIILSLLGFTFYLTQSPVGALIGDISHDETVGLTYGANFALKYGIGSFSPAIAGYLATRYSLSSAFYFFAAISALCFVLTLLLRGELLKRSVV